TLQSLAIELCRGIVQKQRGRGLREVLEEAQLGNRHGYGDQLLLSPGQDLARRPAVQAHGNVGAMWPCMSQVPRLVSRAGSRERLLQRLVLAPAAEVMQVDFESTQGGDGFQPIRLQTG